MRSSTPTPRAHGYLMAAGALFAGAALFLLSLLPEVPSEAAGMAAWVGDGKALLSWSDELLFFAVVSWAAGARVFFTARRTERSARISVGLSALAVGLVSLLVVLLVVGRLVYPVFGIGLSGDSLALLVSSTYGAVHLALLGFAVAAGTLTWSTRGGLPVRVAGVVVAVVFVVGSFPWLVPGWWNTLVAVLLGVRGGFLGIAGSEDAGEAPQSSRYPAACFRYSRA